MSSEKTQARGWPTIAGDLCCLDCQSAERPHRSHGLCRSCVQARRCTGQALPSPLVERAAVGWWAPRLRVSCCVDCGTTAYAHDAHGRCTRCDGHARRTTAPPQSPVVPVCVPRRSRAPNKRAHGYVRGGPPSPRRHALGARVVAAIRREYGVTVALWDTPGTAGHTGARGVAPARHLAAFLLFYWCGYATMKASEAIGRDHSTAAYGITKVERALRAGDAPLRAMVAAVLAQVDRPALPIGGEDAEMMALLQTIYEEDAEMMALLQTIYEEAGRVAPVAPRPKTPLDVYWEKRNREKAASWVS